VQLLAGDASAGAARGRAGDTHLYIDHDGSLIAAQAWAGRQGVRVALGPAFEWHRWRTGFSGVDSTRWTTRSVGAVASVSARVPLWRALGVDLTGQGRLLTDARMPTAGARRPPAGLPTRASVSHWYLGAGPSLRF
jgi:hypothetical protein